MMKEPKNLKTKWLHLRLTEAEYQLLQKQFETTTERDVSTYARKVFLRKPVIKGHRDLSMEALIVELAGLLKTLNGIANNFNQAVHVLHTLHRIQDYKTWITQYDQDKKMLLSNVQELKEYIHKTSSKWLQ